MKEFYSPYSSWKEAEDEAVPTMHLNMSLERELWSKDLNGRRAGPSKIEQRISSNGAEYAL
jgi:hypothetical protein